MLAAAEAMFTEDWEPHFCFESNSARAFSKIPAHAVRSAGLSITPIHRSRPSPNVAAFGNCGLHVVDPGIAMRSRDAGARPWHAREVYVGKGGRTAKPATILLLSYLGCCFDEILVNYFCEQESMGMAGSWGLDAQ
jgi:hypothetical protein